MKRGKPLRSNPQRTREWQARTRRALARESVKRKSERVQRTRVVELVKARDGNVCHAAPVVFWVPCGGPLDPHELAPRSVRPGGHLDPTNVRLVCRVHHGWIGDNPSAAHAVGLHRYSWEER